jgi:hypothetical protein
MAAHFLLTSNPWSFHVGVLTAFDQRLVIWSFVRRLAGTRDAETASESSSDAIG